MLLDRAQEVLGADTRVDVEFVADIPTTRFGKFRQVVRDDDPSPGAEAKG
jgi:hypothetical protein